MRPQPARSSDLRHLTVTTVALSSAALAACGGGGGSTTNINVDTSGGTPAADSAASVTTLLPEEDAARFLAQAGLSATPASVAKLVANLVNGKPDYKTWLDEQFAMVPAQGLWSQAMSYGFDKVPKMIDSDAGMDNLLWFRLFSAPDELRQRVTLALSEIFVVSARNMPVPWGQFNCLAYWDVLEQNCFGTFRNLIEAITLSPAMGVYLSMRGSQKAGGKDGADIGRRPDEN